MGASSDINQTLYFLHGPRNVAQIWKYKTSITDPGVQTFVMTRVFGMSEKAVKMYALDKSGIMAKAATGSDVKPNNRIDYLTHAAFQRFANGEDLTKLSIHWLANFTGQLEVLDVKGEWVEFPDMMSFLDPTSDNLID